MSKEFKQCPNGHFYQGNECPYCRTHPSAGKDSITIGRSIENDLIIDDPKVTRVHCRIERIGEERYRIIDLQSENGTYVNGKRLVGSMEIGPFDVIRLGDTNVQWLHQFAAPDRWDDHIMMGMIAPPVDFFPHQDPTEKKDCLTPKAKEPKWEHHKCPNGHYYQGDGPCPYCPSPKPPKKEKKDDVLKVCHNLHAYDAKLNKCKICESSIVVDKFVWKGSDARNAIYIHFVAPVRVKIGEKELIKSEYIFVELPHLYKYGYFISEDKFHGIEIEPDCDIQIDNTSMTGREFIRLCDLVLENNLSNRDFSTVNVRVEDLIQLHNLLKSVKNKQTVCQGNLSLKYGDNEFNYTGVSDDGVPIFSVKVCPNGHGYDVSQTTCPFCGSDIVSEIVKKRAAFTLVIADLPFVTNGVPVSCDYAEVDGNTLTGDLCMRIEYSGSFKYAYYISQKGKENSESLLVNPTSHIKVTGDDFSDTFAGRDFYKMCDDLFEKNERPQSNSDKKNREYKQCPNGHYYQGDNCPYCRNLFPDIRVTIAGPISKEYWDILRSNNDI